MIGFTFFSNGKLSATSATLMFKREAGWKGILDHGFYYGPTQLPEMYVVKNYFLTAVDAEDEAGRKHDRAYDFVGATADNGTKSWGSIEADEAIIALQKKFLIYMWEELILLMVKK